MEQTTLPEIRPQDRDGDRYRLEIARAERLCVRRVRIGDQSCLKPLDNQLSKFAVVELWIVLLERIGDFIQRDVGPRWKHESIGWR